MSDTVYVPAISEADYETFRVSMNEDFPYPYDKWLNQRAQWREGYAAKGDVVRDVQISPDQFTRYLARTRHAPDLRTFMEFAMKLGRGEID